MSYWYTLDKDNNPVPQNDPVRMEFEDKVVYQEEIFALRGLRPGHERLSTVFLGLDHSFSGNTPVLWETMSFPEDSWSENKFNRYTSYIGAVEGHKAIRKELQYELYSQLWKAVIPTFIFFSLIIGLARA